MDANLELCASAYGTWGAGGFHGEDKMALIDKHFTEDLVLDATMKSKHNPDAYIKYKNHAGFIDWMNFLTAFDFREFTPSFSVCGDMVLAHCTYYVKVKKIGKESEQMTDVHVWKFRDGKICSAKMCWGNPEAMDAIWEA